MIYNKLSEMKKDDKPGGGLVLQCNFCNQTLSKKGAILLGPPSENIHKLMDIDPAADVCRKFHLCHECYDKIIIDMKISKEIREWKPRSV